MSSAPANYGATAPTPSEPTAVVGTGANANVGTSTNTSANANAGAGAPLATKGEAKRIEPKVWFANERTWLNWCRAGVLLGSFGVALTNASPAVGARALGVVYSCIAIATIFYGWVVYQKRIQMIMRRHPGHFDEPAGPVIIALALFLAILVNFILRAVDREQSRRAGGAPRGPWIAAAATGTLRA